MRLTFASYNIHKAVGLDRRRDPERILTVLREIDADVIALQEADRRFGARAGVLPRRAIAEHTPYHVVPLAMTPEGLGWHGNALLVRKGVDVHSAAPVMLPTIEPRGAVCVELSAGGARFRVVGMHLDLSGLRRRHQLRAVQAYLERCGERLPAVLMGDFNEWSSRSGALRELGRGWQALRLGPSFPARWPLAQLDHIVASAEWRVRHGGVHHSAASAIASDHLPVKAQLELITPLA